MAGPLSAPEHSPALDRARVVPCPAHMHGHPTVVITPCPHGSAPLRHLCHQLEPANASMQTSDSRLNRRRTRDIKLWALIPVAFRSDSGVQAVGEVSPAQPQRPTFLDSIDHSGELPLVSHPRLPLLSVPVCAQFRSLQANQTTLSEVIRPLGDQVGKHSYTLTTRGRMTFILIINAPKHTPRGGYWHDSDLVCTLLIG